MGVEKRLPAVKSFGDSSSHHGRNRSLSRTRERSSPRPPRRPSIPIVNERMRQWTKAKLAISGWMCVPNQDTVICPRLRIAQNTMWVPRSGRVPMTPRAEKTGATTAIFATPQNPLAPRIPRAPRSAPVTPRVTHQGILPPMLKEDEGKITVVLDMDETLLHSEFEGKSGGALRQSEKRKKATREADFKLQVTVNNGALETVKVYKRPWLDEFLMELSKEFEVVVFTAAAPCYAKPVLDRMDSKGCIRHRLYRDSTVTHKGQPFVKDISLLGRSLKRTVLVDNNAFAMMASPDNSIPIMSFYDSQIDRELVKLLRLLRAMKPFDDIRPKLISTFGYREKMTKLLAAMQMQKLK